MLAWNAFQHNFKKLTFGPILTVPVAWHLILDKFGQRIIHICKFATDTRICSVAPLLLMFREDESSASLSIHINLATVKGRFLNVLDHPSPWLMLILPRTLLSWPILAHLAQLRSKEAATQYNAPLSSLSRNITLLHSLPIGSRWPAPTHFTEFSDA